MKRSVGPKALLYPTPVLVIGTYDEGGRANVMTAAWGGICCSKPPSVTVSVRSGRYTHGNITRRGAFTVNVPSQDYVAQADYFGIVSGEQEDKLAASGLHAEPAEHVNAPFVAEFPLVLECRLVMTNELGAHTQFIGEIVDVKVEESCLADGKVSAELLRPCVYAPEDGGYYALGVALGQAFSIGRPFVGR